MEKAQLLCAEPQNVPSSCARCVILILNPGRLLITTLFPQVRQLQESAAQLRTVYAGEKAEAIACREHEVMQCWKELLTSCEECRLQITTETDKLRFFSMVRDQIMWMESIICQIGTGEKPRCAEKSNNWRFIFMIIYGFF